MPKLASPVQYESALDGLNTIRPLQLADVGKIVIPYPVLCKDPPSKGRPAVGKVVRCTQQGALIRDNSLFADKVYTKEPYWDFNGQVLHYSFPTKVKSVLAKFYTWYGDLRIYWSNPAGVIHYKELVEVEYLFLPFNGKDMHFAIDFEDYFGVTILLKGFYK